MTRHGWVVIAVLTVLLGGCASMSKEECKTANWEIVGFDDGSHGNPVTLIKRHQEDCAGVVTPDFAAYQKGHARGVARYCVAGNGYNSGIRGYRANTVCDPAGFPNYYDAHQMGLTIFQSAQDVKRQTADLQQAYQARADAEYDIKVVEAELVAPGLSSIERLQLLAQSRQMREDIKGYDYPIGTIEQRLQGTIQHHNDLLASNPYEKRPFVTMPEIKVVEKPDPILAAQEKYLNRMQHHDHDQGEHRTEPESLSFEAYIINQPKHFSMKTHPRRLIKDRIAVTVSDKDLWRVKKRDQKFLSVHSNQYQLFRFDNKGPSEIRWSGYTRRNGQIHMYYWNGHEFVSLDTHEKNADSDYSFIVDLPQHQHHIYVLINSSHGGLYTDKISAHLNKRRHRN